MRPTGSPGRLVVATATGVVVALLVACGGPRNSLNTDASVCFRALAVASEAVHHKGKLVGVRKVSAHKFAQHLPETTAEVHGSVCLVAYEAGYLPGQVVDASPPGPGRYAIVAVSAGDPVLLGATIIDKLPSGFGHPA